MAELSSWSFNHATEDVQAASMADSPRVASWCPYCHGLDLRDSALTEDLSDESIEAGLYLSWGEGSADFNILGESLQPDNPRLSECFTCALISDFLAQLDPVLSVVRKWKNAEIEVSLEVSKNIKVYVDTGLTIPGGRSYELYMPVDIEYPFPGQGRRSEDLDPLPGNNALWGKLETWLSDCQREHAECRSESAGWKPTRLVKVDKDRQYLTTTSELSQGPESLKYAALSHCWGKEQPLRTLSLNLADHTSDIPWQKLPRVFQDGITVARRLGISYLWIDSLCIIQDDIEDWARESQMMGSVYEQAYLTISATVCENGIVPFLGPDAPHEPRRWVTSRKDFSSKALKSLRARRIPNSKQFEGPIMSRAWTLQERLFSPRIIHFTQFQTQWKCRQIQSCESGPLRLLQGSGRAGSTKDIALGQWNDRLLEYSRLSLTQFSDKLPAISGIAASFQSKIDSEYLVGLWKTRLPQQLAWRMTNEEWESQNLLVEAASALPADRPPSWSWASVIGAIWTWVPNLDKSYITIEDTACNPSTSNIFGQVKSGASLRLRCLIAEVEIFFQPNETLASDKYRLKLANGGGYTASCSPDCLLATSASEDQWAARATADDIVSDMPWSAKAMLMPLVAERETPPCGLLLGKQPGYEEHVFQRIAFVSAMLEEHWEAIQERLQPHHIVLQ